MSEVKNCSHKNLVVIDEQETYEVKGEQITIQSKVKKCMTCDKEIFDMVLDTENLKKAYRIYKTKHNLMQSEEILALRKKYNLTQNMLAMLIGCTQATIARYENGSIQSETHNTALVLLKNPENIKKIFEKNRANLIQMSVRYWNKFLAEVAMFQLSQWICLRICTAIRQMFTAVLKNST